MGEPTLLTPAPSRLAGYLRATSTRAPDGRCYLSLREHRVPIHIGKSYWDGYNLLLNVMSPTAGMLEGDSVEVDIKIEEGSNLTLSNPSALRIHKMGPDGNATWNQRFFVAPNGFLETNPEWLILQGESSFEQATRIDVAEGGELFFIEALAPGRVAHGESFAFRRFANRVELRYAEQLAALEKHCVEPQRQTHLAWQGFGRGSFHVSIFCASHRLSADSGLWSALHELHAPDLAIGCSQLAAGPCWNIRILSADPTLARHAIVEARRLFCESVQRPAAALRRS